MKKNASLNMLSDAIIEAQLYSNVRYFEDQKILTYLCHDINDIICIFLILCFTCLFIVAGSFILVFSALTGILAWCALSSLIVIPLHQRVWRFRRERHMSRIALTKIRAKKTLDKLTSQGLQFFFFLDGLRDSDHMCNSCHEQVISIAVRQRFQPVPSAPVTEKNISKGVYCPHCGIPASNDNPISGDTKELLWHLEAGRGSRYVLRPPTSKEDIQMCLDVLDTTIKQRELELAQDIAERDRLRESQVMKELEKSPFGYRVSIEETETAETAETVEAADEVHEESKYYGHII